MPERAALAALAFVALSAGAAPVGFFALGGGVGEGAAPGLRGVLWLIVLELPAAAAVAGAIVLSRRLGERDRLWIAAVVFVALLAPAAYVVAALDNAAGVSVQFEGAVAAAAASAAFSGPLALLLRLLAWRRTAAASEQAGYFVVYIAAIVWPLLIGVPAALALPLGSLTAVSAEREAAAVACCCVAGVATLLLFWRCYGEHFVPQREAMALWLLTSVLFVAAASSATVSSAGATRAAVVAAVTLLCSCIVVPFAAFRAPRALKLTCLAAVSCVYTVACGATWLAVTQVEWLALAFLLCEVRPSMLGRTTMAVVLVYAYPMVAQALLHADVGGSAAALSLAIAVAAVAVLTQRSAVLFAARLWWYTDNQLLTLIVLYGTEQIVILALLRNEFAEADGSTLMAALVVALPLVAAACVGWLLWSAPNKGAPTAIAFAVGAGAMYIGGGWTGAILLPSLGVTLVGLVFVGGFASVFPEHIDKGAVTFTVTVFVPAAVLVPAAAAVYGSSSVPAVRAIAVAAVCSVVGWSAFVIWSNQLADRLSKEKRAKTACQTARRQLKERGARIGNLVARLLYDDALRLGISEFTDSFDAMVAVKACRKRGYGSEVCLYEDVDVEEAAEGDTLRHELEERAFLAKEKQLSLQEEEPAGQEDDRPSCLACFAIEEESAAAKATPAQNWHRAGLVGVAEVRRTHAGRWALHSAGTKLAKAHRMALLKRTFEAYATGGAGNPEQLYLGRAEWRRFCRDANLTLSAEQLSKTRTVAGGEHLTFEAFLEMVKNINGSLL